MVEHHSFSDGGSQGPNPTPFRVVPKLHDTNHRPDPHSPPSFSLRFVGFRSLYYCNNNVCSLVILYVSPRRNRVQGGASHRDGQLT
jgi:hypothetical protein